VSLQEVIVKRLVVIVLSVLGLVLLTAPTAVEYHPVFLNGKPFGAAIMINGKPAMALIDFCKLGGGTLTLEEVGLTLNGASVGVSAAAFDAFHKHIKKAEASVNGGMPAAVNGGAPAAVNGAGTVAVKMESNRRWARQNDGLITNNALKFGGGVYIPLADIARAFGGTLTSPATLQPGEAIRLNFTKSPNAILIGL